MGTVASGEAEFESLQKMQMLQPGLLALHDRLTPTSQIRSSTGLPAMESCLRAGQRWLHESDVSAKLGFCSLLGINVKAPPNESASKLLAGVLIPFAFLKPLFDRLDDHEVARRLGHLQPSTLTAGKEVNKRKELAVIYRKIVEWCRGPHFTSNHLTALARYLGLPNATKEEVLSSFLYSFIFSTSSPHFGYSNHITIINNSIAGDAQFSLSFTAPWSTTTTTSSSTSPSPSSSSPPSPPSFSSVHTNTRRGKSENGASPPTKKHKDVAERRATDSNGHHMVKVKQEPIEDDTGAALAQMIAGGVKIEKRESEAASAPGSAGADDPTRDQRERSVAGRRSLKRPLPSTLPPPSSSSSSLPMPVATRGPSSAQAGFAPLPSPFAPSLFPGGSATGAMPIHPSLYLSALQSSSLTPQMLASLTGFGPLIYPPSMLAGFSPAAFIQPKPVANGASSSSSSASAPSPLSSSSSSLPAGSKYTQIHPAGVGGGAAGYPPILPLPPILPFPSTSGSNGPTPQQLSSSAPSIATLKRKAEKEAEEERKRPLSRTAPVRGTSGKGSAELPLPSICRAPSPSSGHASGAASSSSSSAVDTATVSSVLAFRSALASVGSLSPPSPSSFDAPFCSSFSDSTDVSPFSGASNGPFSPFSPLFSSPTSYSSTVISATTTSSLTSSSLFTASASSHSSLPPVDLVGTETGSHGNRYYYGAPFPEIEALEEGEQQQKLDYLNVDVIVVPKEEPKPAPESGDPKSSSGRGRGGRRSRGGSRGLGRSTEDANASSATTSRGALTTSSERTTVTAGGQDQGPAARAGGRTMAATHPVPLTAPSQAKSAVTRPSPVNVQPTLRPTVKTEKAVESTNAVKASGGSNKPAPSRTQNQTPEEAERSEAEYQTAELLLSLGFGKTQQSVGKKSEETEEDGNNSDGPLLEAPIVGSVDEPREDDDEPELCIAEEDDEEEEDGSRDPKKRKRVTEEKEAEHLGSPAKSPKRDNNDHRVSSHAVPVMPA